MSKVYSDNDIYLELALIINREMYSSNFISYQVYQLTEEILLKKSSL